MKDDHDDASKRVTPQTPIKLEHAEKWQCCFLIGAAFMWTYEGRQKYSDRCDRCVQERTLQWERCLLRVPHEQRIDVLLRREKVPATSRRLLNHHSSSDTLTHSHSVQKPKHIHRDTNSPSTRLLTFLRCSEVNSLNRLIKPVQSAVVNPQLKNRIFGRIASFSHIEVGGGRGGGAERWRFLLQL